MAQEEGAGKGTERIISIDIIRGFSIFGIFLVNMMDFHSPLLYVEPLTWWSNPLDHTTYIVIDLMAQASFYPLFSIMFGFSIVLLLEKVKSRGLNQTMLVVRRLIVLLIFGLIHAFFVWHGDILIQYAMLGFILLFFLALSGRNLMAIGLSLYVIPVVFLSLILFIMATGIPSEELAVFDNEAAKQSIHVYSQGTFMDITEQRVNDWQSTNDLGNVPFLFISIFPLFLIGAGIAKLKWLEQPDKHRHRLTLLVIIMFVLGLFLKSMPYLLKGALFAQYVQDSIGGVCLAIFFGAFIVKIIERPRLKKWLSPLAAVGRMSISNYLFQSLLSSFIFYQYGLGLYGNVSLFTGTILVFVIFSFQILVSRLWLSRFSYGPVEWLWRVLTYMKPVKLRKPGV
ncbi:DUF418 domain-containing protein [Neobacillus sp. LXY-4]|uniref:DUF418 domain-containing protein n=1 Tax=Neobacillus sp. LXY-4 TaxID=3379826 RepID=UPI003EE151B5